MYRPRIAPGGAGAREKGFAYCQNRRNAAGLIVASKQTGSDDPHRGAVS
jgi:hypothetical protein